MDALATCVSPACPAAVSAIVCSILFVLPLIRALTGDRDAGRDPSVPAVLGGDMPASDVRRTMCGRG